MDQLGFGDCGMLANGAEDFFADFSIEPHEGNSFGADSGFAAAKGEGCDVYAMLAECSADVANDAGFVVIADIEHGAFKLSFQGDAIDIDDPRGAIVEDRTFGAKTLRPGLVWQSSHFESVREAVLAAASFLFDSQAARRSDSGCVDDVHFSREDGVQQSGQDGAAQKVCADFGEFSSVADFDTGRAGSCGLGHERAELLSQHEIRTNAAVLIWL